jgi:hypothetical protein
MTNYWVPVIAALGASALTGLIAFGLDALRAHRDNTERLTERRARAYSQMLSHAAAFALAVGAMHLTAQLRSGFTEGLDVTLHHRKPVDPLELHDWLMRELGPMLEALSEIWVVGTQESVEAGNDLMKKCNDVLGLGTNRGKVPSRFVRIFVGEKWSTEQRKVFDEAAKVMADARKRLAEVARRELGVGFAALFTVDGSDSKMEPSPLDANVER